MNYKSRLRNVRNRDYQKFSKKQNKKYLAKQYEDLGLNVPKYLDNLTPSNITKALNRLGNQYAKEIRKEIKLKAQRKKIKKNVAEEMAKAINSYNRAVKNTVKKMNKYYPEFMEENYNYLRGEDVFNPVSRKSFRKDGILLKEVSITDLYFKDKNAMTDYIMKLKKMTNDVKFSNYQKNLTNKAEQEKYFKELVNDEGNGLTETDKKLLIKKFKTLNPVQQEKVNKVGLRQMIQKYKDLYEEGETSDNSLNATVFNKINSALSSIGGI